MDQRTSPDSPTKEDFEAILTFLPIFSDENFSVGDLAGPFFFDYAPEVDEFMEVIRTKHWMYPFDWVPWQDHADRYFKNPELMNYADILTIRKFLTTHMRKERFVEGHMADMVECGHITDLLSRLQVIYDQEGYLGTNADQEIRPSRTVTEYFPEDVDKREYQLLSRWDPEVPHRAWKQIYQDQVASLCPQDGSPESYLMASLLKRLADDWELLHYTEMGWHASGWSDFQIIGPESDSLFEIQEEDGFHWEGEPVAIRNPSVRIEEGNIRVQFYLYTQIGFESLIFEEDVYRPGNYEFVTNETTIAYGTKRSMH